jgi:thiol-disulfide isomerase/thioredoxin
MSSLLFLSSQDFNVSQGTSGNILTTPIMGFSLIMFYSPKCVYCQKLIPIFKQLPQYVAGCKFGMINVSQQRDIIRMASQTIVPIKYVPLIILYINGNPYMKYEGPGNMDEIRDFILQIANSIQSQNSFATSTRGANSTPQTSSGGGRVIERKNELPIYGGIPLCGDDGVCYLEYNEAYPHAPR